MCVEVVLIIKKVRGKSRKLIKNLICQCMCLDRNGCCMQTVCGPAFGISELCEVPHAPRTAGQFLFSLEKNMHRSFDSLFEKNTEATVWDQQQKAIQ
ncbi:hypothetical protein ANCDUO_19815, partial [Ancylostoma duodenale]